MPLCPSSSSIVPLGMLASAPDRAHHRRDAEGVGQDRGVRGAGALLAHQPDDVLPVELDGEAGRELVGHDDHLLVGRHRRELGAGAAQQPVDDPELDGVQVGEPLPQPRCSRTTGSAAPAP